jgi:hypothetical protein
MRLFSLSATAAKPRPHADSVAPTMNKGTVDIFSCSCAHSRTATSPCTVVHPAIQPGAYGLVHAPVD